MHLAKKSVIAGDDTVNSFDLYFNDGTNETYESMDNLENAAGIDGKPINGKHVKVADHHADMARYAIHGYYMDNNQFLETSKSWIGENIW